MSDLLDKLLLTEKSAAQMVSSAEAEANRRKSEARAEAQKRHAAVLKDKAAESEKAVSEEKERTVTERREKNADYRARLAGHPVDRDAFFRVVSGLIETD